jgi:hypothetical protein
MWDWAIWGALIFAGFARITFGPVTVVVSRR